MKKRVISLLIAAALCMTACGSAGPGTAAQSQAAGEAAAGPGTTEQSQAVGEAAAGPGTAEAETGAETNSEPEETGAEPESTGKILVAYFSKTGNTEAVAKMIAGTTGADLFKVETATPYPEDYNETVDIAREEQDNDARPELSTHVENMAQYDVVFLGYPNWWGTMPMAMFTFLEEYDFTGKTIIPFCTHGGSALGSSESDIESLCPDSQILEGLAVSGSRAGNAQSDVEAWVKGLGITPGQE